MKESWPDWKLYVNGCCTCVYCGFGGIDNFHAWRQLAIDHLIPVSCGGQDTLENKVVSCHRCNTLKGSWNPVKDSDGPSVDRHEFIARVKKYLDLDNSEEHRDFKLMMDEIRRRMAAIA